MGIHGIPFDMSIFYKNKRVIPGALAFPVPSKLSPSQDNRETTALMKGKKKGKKKKSDR